MASAPFPTEVAAFDADPRIELEPGHIYTLLDEEGTKWVWDEVKRLWVDYISSDDDHQVRSNQEHRDKKRKASPAGSAMDPESKKAKAEETQPHVQENKAIFITGLPADTTIADLDFEFSKAGGIIDQSVDGSKRIRMYTDDNGKFTGEALVIYYKKESVQIAIARKDGFWFRPKDGGTTISVRPADISYKKQKDATKVKTHMSREERKAYALLKAEMDRQLTGWSDDDADYPAAQPYAPEPKKSANIVIIKNAFDLDEVKGDVDEIKDVKDEIKDEAKKYGKVDSVIVYDSEPEGVVVIRFSKEDDATHFKKKCHGRQFDNRKLTVNVVDTEPLFKRTNTPQ